MKYFAAALIAASLSSVVVSAQTTAPAKPEVTEHSIAIPQHWHDAIADYQAGPQREFV